MSACAVTARGCRRRTSPCSTTCSRLSAADRKIRDRCASRCRFKGHPHLERILLPRYWQGHPGRKDHPARGNEEEDFIKDPLALESALNQIPGVVTVGLFAQRSADVLLIGSDAGVRQI
jgi:hypothetical protein